MKNITTSLSIFSAATLVIAVSLVSVVIATAQITNEDCCSDGGGWSTDTGSSWVTDTGSSWDVGPSWSADTGANWVTDTGSNWATDSGSNWNADMGANWITDTGSNWATDTGANWLSDTGSNWNVDQGASWITDAGSNWQTDTGSLWATDTGTDWFTDTGSNWTTDTGSFWATDTGTNWQTDVGGSFVTDAGSSWITDSGSSFITDSGNSWTTDIGNSTSSPAFKLDENEGGVAFRLAQDEPRTSEGGVAFRLAQEEGGAAFRLAPEQAQAYRPTPSYSQPAPQRYASAQPQSQQISAPRYDTGGWSHGRVETAQRTTPTGYVGGGYGGGYAAPRPSYPSYPTPSYPSYPAPYPPSYPPSYPPQPPQPPYAEGVRCDAFYFTNQYGQRTETAYQGESVTLIWSTIGGRANGVGIIGLGQVAPSGSRSFNNFRVGTHQLTLRVIGANTGNQTDCTATITVMVKSVPQPPHPVYPPVQPPVYPPIVYPPTPVCCHPTMPVYPHQPVVYPRPLVYPQTTYQYAVRPPAPVEYVGTRYVQQPSPVEYVASVAQAVTYIEQPQLTVCSDGTMPVRDARTGKLTCYTQATCPAGTYPQGERNGALVCAHPTPAPVVVEKPVYQIVEKPVYVPKEVIVEKKVAPRVSVVTKVIDPIEKVTLDQIPETGAEDYFMPLFYVALALSAAYAVRSSKLV